jgi:hypothetical protein
METELFALVLKLSRGKSRDVAATASNWITSGCNYQPLIPLDARTTLFLRLWSIYFHTTSYQS